MLEIAIPILVGGILAAFVIGSVEKKKQKSVSAVSNNTEGKEVNSDD